MFTGLIQQKGRFIQLGGAPGASVIEVACAPWPNDPLVPGESVAVQGACLTVVSPLPTGFTADVLAETLRCTTLGRLRQNDPVNLERAVRPMDRLGGHLVTGHVDGTGEIRSITRSGRDYVVQLACGVEEARYLARKGSVALDGVSLTVSAVPAEGVFEVCIIPTTWRETAWSGRAAGDTVNVEVDVIARYVEHLSRSDVERARPGLSLDTLMNAGF